MYMRVVLLKSSRCRFLVLFKQGGLQMKPYPALRLRLPQQNRCGCGCGRTPNRNEFSIFFEIYAKDVQTLEIALEM